MGTQNIPTIRIPFEYVQGIPPQAAMEIYRDFQEVINAIPTSTLSSFDAIIDSSLTTSLPASHHYKNLTDLLANENWTTTLLVEVRQYASSTQQIVEPGTTSLAGKGDLALVGFDPWVFTDGTHKGWDWQVLTVPANQQFYAYGVNFAPTTAQKLVSGSVSRFDNCLIAGSCTGIANNGNSFNQAFAFGCQIQSTHSYTSGPGASLLLGFFSCEWTNDMTVDGTSTNVYIQGGGWRQQGTLTINSVVLALVGCNLNGVTINGPTTVYINNTGDAGNASLNCTNTPTYAEIHGAFFDVTFTGTPAAGHTRIFEGSAAHSLTFVGPGRCDATIYGSASTSFGGSCVDGKLTFLTGGNPWFNAVALLDSVITIQVGPGSGIGQKAYAFDAASFRNLLIIGGYAGANFTVAGTDASAGGTNRVITNAGDTLIPGGGGTPQDVKDFTHDFMLMGG
jgi:hypothetical protein